MWNVYEQVLISALDVGDEELAKRCLQELITKFSLKSSRVCRLEIMVREAFAESEEALKTVLNDYDDLLATNPTNVLVLKRRICVLKALGDAPRAASALNEVLRTYASDVGCWMELADMHLATGTGGMEVCKLALCLL